MSGKQVILFNGIKFDSSLADGIAQSLCNGQIEYMRNSGVIETSAFKVTAESKSKLHITINNKPRTKVEYVKANFDKVSDVAIHYENGDVLYCDNDGYIDVNVYGAISMHRHNDDLYRRTEIPYTWLDEVSEYVDSIAKAADEIKDEELITIEGTFTREQLVKLGEIIKG